MRVVGGSIDDSQAIPSSLLVGYVSPRIIWRFYLVGERSAFRVYNGGLVFLFLYVVELGAK